MVEAEIGRAMMYQYQALMTSLRWNRHRLQLFGQSKGGGELAHFISISAAIAALVPHNDVVKSVRLAKDYLTGALQRADELDVGSGHGPVHHFHALWSAPAMRGERR